MKTVHDALIALVRAAGEDPTSLKPGMTWDSDGLHARRMIRDSGGGFIVDDNNEIVSAGVRIPFDRRLNADALEALAAEALSAANALRVPGGAA